MPWPGNVRQLENTCRWLQVMASSRTVLIEDLPPNYSRRKPTPSWVAGSPAWNCGQTSNLKRIQNLTLLDAAQPKFERIMINAALRKTGGRKKDAAELLGWGRNTLTRKMQELEL